MTSAKPSYAAKAQQNRAARAEAPDKLEETLSSMRHPASEEAQTPRAPTKAPRQRGRARAGGGKVYRNTTVGLSKEEFEDMRELQDRAWAARVCQAGVADILRMGLRALKVMDDEQFREAALPFARKPKG